MIYERLKWYILCFQLNIIKECEVLKRGGCLAGVENYFHPVAILFRKQKAKKKENVEKTEVKQWKLYIAADLKRVKWT